MWELVVKTLPINMAIKEEIKNVKDEWYEELNDKWCDYLKEFWTTTLYNENLKLRRITKRLSLAVTPIAILPFERHLYAKYVDPDANQFGGSKYKLLVNSKRPRSPYMEDIPLAKGLYDSILINNPYIWHKLLPRREDVKVEEIDEEVEEFEIKLFESKLKKLPSMESRQVKAEGHFAIPLFHGTFPIYCLVVISNTISPDIFNARYLRETFDMIGRIGESILNDNFIGLWEDFCDNYKEIGEPGRRKRKNVFRVLEKRLLGEIPKREYSSWIHSLPGHCITENEGQMIIKEKFENKWKPIKDRFIEGEIWYEKQIKKLMDIAKEIELFGDIKSSHKVKCEKDLTKIRNKISKEKDFIMESENVEWLRDIIKILVESEFDEAQMAFYKLKSILNITDYNYTNKTISPGFIHMWPLICKQGSMQKLYDYKIKTINFYIAEVYNCDPFEYVKNFYGFIKAFNTHEEKRPCEILKIQITSSDKNMSTAIEIKCILSKEFPSNLKNLLLQPSKHANILKGRGCSNDTSFFLCKLIKTCKCELVNYRKKEIIRFRLVSR
jgi:hypothetical protein